MSGSPAQKPQHSKTMLNETVKLPRDFDVHGPPRREQQACSVLPDPEDTEAYSKWIDELTGQCTCEGMDKPCDRLLVGGHCDDMHLCSDDFANDGDDYSPVDLATTRTGARAGSVCACCTGWKWVCEDHPDKAWESGDENECKCGAAGMPCPDCNPAAKPIPGSLTIWELGMRPEIN